MLLERLTTELPQLAFRGQSTKDEVSKLISDEQAAYDEHIDKEMADTEAYEESELGAVQKQSAKSQEVLNEFLSFVASEGGELPTALKRALGKMVERSGEKMTGNVEEDLALLRKLGLSTEELEKDGDTAKRLLLS